MSTLSEKWHDRANDCEYKLHREWAIDQCAEELDARDREIRQIISLAKGSTDFRTLNYALGQILKKIEGQP